MVTEKDEGQRVKCVYGVGVLMAVAWCSTMRRNLATIRVYSGGMRVVLANDVSLAVCADHHRV